MCPAPAPPNESTQPLNAESTASAAPAPAVELPVQSNLTQQASHSRGARSRSPSHSQSANDGRPRTYSVSVSGNGSPNAAAPSPHGQSFISAAPTPRQTSNPAASILPPALSILAAFSPAEETHDRDQARESVMITTGSRTTTGLFEVEKKQWFEAAQKFNQSTHNLHSHAHPHAHAHGHHEQESKFGGPVPASSPPSHAAAASAESDPLTRSSRGNSKLVASSSSPDKANGAVSSVEMIDLMEKGHGHDAGQGKHEKLMDANAGSSHEDEKTEASAADSSASAAVSEELRLARLSLAELSGHFDCDLNTGLPLAEIAARLRNHGPNTLQQEARKPIWLAFFEQFLNPMVAMLAVSSIIALSLREYIEGGAVLVTVFINAFLAVYMDAQAQSALAALLSLSAPTATVIRGGQSHVIPSSDLVPGDILLLKSGDLVPGDCRILEGAEIKVNEMLLTGESEEVHKTVVPPPAGTLDSLTTPNILYSSTHLSSGNVKALVLSTGMNTRIGNIAALLQSTGKKGKGLKHKHSSGELSDSSQSPLGYALERIGIRMGFAAVSICSLILIIGILTNYRDPDHQDSPAWLQSLLISITLAVSAIPEGLPLATTVCLVLGSTRMAKVNVLVRRLAAVEALGACSVICTDKTGTLTEGKMTAVKAYAGGKLYNIGSSEGGFAPFGAFTTKDGNKITEDQQSHHALEMSLFAGFLCSNTNLEVEKAATPDGKPSWRVVGGASEAPLVVAASKMGWNVDYWRRMYAKAEEIPFNSARKLMVTVHDIPSDRNADSTKSDSGSKFSSDDQPSPSKDASPNAVPLAFGMLPATHRIPLLDVLSRLVPASSTSAALSQKRLVCLKGAPDYVLSLCQQALNNDGVLEPIDSRAIMNTVDELSSQTLRVLCIAVKLIDVDTSGKKLDSDQLFSSLVSPKDLIFVGLMASKDPVRAGVKRSIEIAKHANIKTVMITGDYLRTAMAIGQELDLFDSDEVALASSVGGQNGESTSGPTTAYGFQVVDSSALRPNGEYLSETELDAIVRRAKIFARARPEDKLQIVRAFQRQGLIAAMTGDGVNDAPALKQANIGVAMGAGGTAVAKQASQLILLDDNFSSIVEGVRLGRGIYNNIQSFLTMLIGTSCSHIVTIFSCVALGFPVILSPLQVLFVNLTTDGLPSLALSADYPEADVMERPPRPPKEPILTPIRVRFIIVHVVLLAFVMFINYLTSLYAFAGNVFRDRILPEGVALADITCKTRQFYGEWIEYRGVECAADALKSAQTVAFITVCFSENFRAFSVRHLYHPWHEEFFKCKILVFAVLISVGLTFLVILAPPVATIFSVHNVPWQYWLQALAGAIFVFLGDEYFKARAWKAERERLFMQKTEDRLKAISQALADFRISMPPSMRH